MTLKLTRMHPSLVAMVCYGVVKVGLEYASRRDRSVPRSNPFLSAALLTVSGALANSVAVVATAPGPFSMAGTRSDSRAA
ncbi:MAG: hypothetical protein MAG715_00165 [Methanonatronarchaeales archaeon]|nr:hypothetical protein [Methanonatronarchaeales archaeon]